MSIIKPMGNKIEIQMIIGIAILLFSVSMAADKKIKSTYIVHMAKFDQIQATLEADVDEPRYFQSSLDSVGSSASPMYEYKHAINGYSARLTAEEAEALKALPQVISVFAETKYELHTTRTPHFLGLDRQPSPPLPNPQQLSNVIIGVVDTGVWPESESFNDRGFPPVPARWGGACENGANFTQSMCNKKLVGARFFLKGYEANFTQFRPNWNAESRSARDDNGHGTHTSTTAAGSPVSGASMLGYAKGTARGMAEYARVAAYKCCWKDGCASSDILAAIDKAIEDKVDIMSLSMGTVTATPYHSDVVAIGAFAAMERGIVVICSAGNSGPTVSSVTNVAPWITTVGAGTLDRDFPALVTLGNGKIFSGASLYSGNESLGRKLLRFVYGGDATYYYQRGNFCLPGSLLPKKIKGKIVLCDVGISSRASKSNVVKEAGGVGTIVANIDHEGEEVVADAYLYLATSVGEKAGVEMKKYLSTDPKPTATISFQGTVVGVKPAPVVAAFSSRGPNTLNPEILKPDLIAPGVNILAGWTGEVGPSEIYIDTRRVPYNIMSGTSMSCPHVSGLAALLKATHPHWSPAAIRSALMTTAYSTYDNGNPILDVATGNASTPFDIGAGHVKPLAALDPGLVYDLTASDYLDFLCATNKYSDEQIKAISRNNTFSCKYNNSYSGLNYPSFAVSIQANQKGAGNVFVSVKQKRTLTNVGPAGTYNVRIIPPSDSVKICVAPNTLTFNRTYDKKSYTVTFKVNPNMPANTHVFGRIEWRDDKKHVVGSAIAVSWAT